MARADDLKLKFKAKREKRVVKESNDYHGVFEQMDDMALGEELKDDVWTIIKVPNGWIVRRINFGVVFVPQN